MTLTPSLTLKKRPRKVNARKRALRAAGSTYADLAQAAGVTESMAWKWMNGERVSEPCTAAFARLTGGQA